MDCAALAWDDQEDISLKSPIVTVMALPYDILVELFSWLYCRTDISRLMRTCKALHAGGVRILLEQSIYLHEGNIDSLCLFLQTDMSRCKHLRNITLEDVPEKLRIRMDFISRALQASNVRELHVMGNTLVTYPQLRTTIARMKSIEELELPRWSKGTLSLLAKIESPVRQFRVFYVPEDDDDWGHNAYLDVFPHLAALQDTLEQLFLDWVGWTDAPVDLRFNNVHTLCIYSCNAVSIMPLITAFPNLRKLTINSDADLRLFVSPTSYDRIRATNISAQEAQCTWSSLDHADLSPVALYLLAPLCKVKTLHTYYHCSVLNRLPPDSWRDALASTPSEILYLCVSLMGNPGAMADVLNGITNKVLKLELTINIHRWVGPTEPAFDTLQHIFSSFTSLTHMNLVLNWSGHPVYIVADLANPNDTEHQAYIPTRYDHLTLADKLAKRMASLKYLGLYMFSDEETVATSGSLYWAVDVVDGKHRLTELSAREGAGFMEWE